MLPLTFPLNQSFILLFLSARPLVVATSGLSVRWRSRSAFQLNPILAETDQGIPFSGDGPKENGHHLTTSPKRINTEALGTVCYRTNHALFASRQLEVRSQSYHEHSIPFGSLSRKGRVCSNKSAAAFRAHLPSELFGSYFSADRACGYISSQQLSERCTAELRCLLFPSPFIQRPDPHLTPSKRYEAVGARSQNTRTTQTKQGKRDSG